MTTVRQAQFVLICPSVRAQVAAIMSLASDYEDEYYKVDRNTDVLNQIIIDMNAWADGLKDTIK